ncbi:MAG: penicillin-binding protein 2 [Gammaproteobacteria bacterium]
MLTLGPIANARGGHPLSRAKDHVREARLFSRRALTALALALGALLALAGRLAFLQVLHHQHFITLSESNRVRIQPLAPTRGLIFDRNGVLLAENLPSHRLEIVPEQVDDLDALLTQLRALVEISDADINRFQRLRRLSPPYSGIPLRFRLNSTEVARLALDLHRFPGVNIKADLTRRYPLAARAAHIIGYVGRIDEKELQNIDGGQYSGTSHIGKTGVERSYEALLHGQVGYQQVETNAQGRILQVLERTPPIPGKNIFLTVDIQLQKVAEEALGDYNGAIVAIDPRNGEILALASMPTYDPNSFVNGIDAEAFSELNTSPDRPLFNRALLGLYPPGSTIKPIMGLAGLELGVIDANKSVFCPGFYRLPTQPRKFRDWKRGGHGRTDLNKAIMQSCDVYFYDLALNLGIDRIHGYLDQFGLGRRTGIDLSGEKAGVLPSQDWKKNAYNQSWYAGETLIAGIGQGYMLTTPLQLAHAIATLAQRGASFQPRLLYATQAQGSDEINLETPRATPSIKVVSSLNWQYVVHAMTQVVHSKQGTARLIGADAPYIIAGKTGTAQVFSLGEDEKYNADQLAKGLHDHALFVAFAPAEDPRIAVAVIVEHGGGGGAVAAPLARQVLDAYLLKAS